MNSALAVMQKTREMSRFEAPSGNMPDGLSRKSPNYSSRSLGQDLNPGPPEYGAGVLTLQREVR